MVNAAFRKRAIVQVKKAMMMMEAASTSEMSVNYHTTRRNNPEDSHFLPDYSAQYPIKQSSLYSPP
jgi:hypothetical protein